MTEICSSEENVQTTTITSKKFAIASVAEKIKNLADEEKYVNLLLFVDIYDELSKFIGMLGKIFEFVEKDLAEKIKVLRKLHSEDSNGYETIQSLVSTEKANRQKEGRTAILHLNRALEFIMQFMTEAFNASDEDSIPKICKGCYDDTIAKYHPWIIRGAVKLALYTLPARQQLVTFVKGNCQDETEVGNNIDIFVKNGTIVFKRINEIMDGFKV